jgi:prepilin signal peptidase PulO-like enzyme (type II secretory pathway)
MLILFVVGLCGGSFVNALVWRLHEQDIEKNKSLKTKSIRRLKSLSILKGHSMCPDCRHNLSWYDLIPIASWVGLRGKCRYCKKTISVQYPVVELFVAIFFILLYSFWPYSLNGSVLQWMIFVCWLVATIIFMALFIYDIKWMILPNKLIYPLGFIAVVAAILSLFSDSSFFTAIWQPLLGIVVVGGFFAVLYFVSKGRWMGFGDVRLGIVIGILLGWQLGLVALISSFYIGAIVVTPIALIKKLKANSKVAFGPFLILSVYVALFWGSTIINWYLYTVVGLR